MSTRRLSSALLAAALGASGCTRPAPTSPLTIAHEGDILSLDPMVAQEAATHSVLSNLYESLVTFDANMRLVPGLAVQWSTVDETTWVIELRAGVQFHDGHPLTSEDVRFTLERARDDPGSGIKGQLAGVASVEVVDPRTLKLHTAGPDPLLMNRLSYVLVVSAAGPPPADLPVGTGPYRFVRREPGRVVEAEAFADYWGGEPPIHRVRFVPVQEGDRTLQALRTGGVDVLRYVPETLTDQVRRLDGFDLVAHAGLTTYYLWPNTLPASPGSPPNPLADRRVRTALSLGIDRKALVAGLGDSVPSDQLVQTGVFGYVGSLPPLTYDPARARILLAEAGYGNGVSLTLSHRAQASMSLVAEDLRDMLASIGVRLNLETPPWNDVVDGWKKGDLSFFLAGWRFENGDAQSFLRDCLYTRDADLNTGSYNSGYSNPELDRMITENGQMFGEANRLRQYERLMRLALDDMPIIPLYHRQNLFAVSHRVRWQPRLDGRLLAWEMSLAE